MLNVSFSRFKSMLTGLVIVIAASAVLAQSDPVTPRQMEILREILRVDSTGLTHKQYEDFWTDFGNLSAEERDALRKSFHSRRAALPKSQRTLWLAARESSKQRRPVFTIELFREFTEIKSNEEDGKRRPGSAAEFKRSTREILEAAAYQTTVLKHGREFKLTPDVVEEILRGLDGSINRLDRLFAESWR